MLTPPRQIDGIGLRLLAAVPALILALVIATPVARAQMDDPDLEVARRHFARGSQFYAAKDYEHALAEFRAAREVKPLPALDYNIARCSDRMEHYPEAIEAYERFVKAAPDDPDTAEARSRAETLRKRLQVKAQRDAAASTQGKSPAVKEAPLAKSPGRRDGGEVVTGTRAHSEGSPSVWSNHPTLKYGLAGAAGAVALGVGIGLTAQGWLAWNQLKTDCAGATCAPGTGSDVRDRTIAGYVLTGVGAAAIVTTAIWYLRTARGARAASTYLVPAFIGNGNGLAVAGVF